MWPLWTAAAIGWMISLFCGLIALFIDPGAITMCLGAGIAAFIFTVFVIVATVADRRGW